MPSYRQLRDAHHVAQNTAQAAVRLLAAEGLVEIRPARGAYVRETLTLLEARICTRSWPAFRPPCSEASKNWPKPRTRLPPCSPGTTPGSALIDRPRPTQRPRRLLCCSYRGFW